MRKVKLRRRKYICQPAILKGEARKKEETYFEPGSIAVCKL